MNMKFDLTPKSPLQGGEGTWSRKIWQAVLPLFEAEKGYLSAHINFSPCQRGEIKRGVLQWLIPALILLLMITAIPPVTMAAPPDQFAGCADEDEEAYAARYVIHDVYDTIFTVTVIGLDGFDPQLMIRHDDTYVCNQDAEHGIYYGVDLPTAQSGFNENTAQLEIRFLEDDPPTDFEILVTGKGGQTGQFVMLYWGASIFGADDVDEVSFSVTEEQLTQQMPFIFYTANFNPAEFRLSPEMSIILGTDFSITCSVSALTDLCPGNTFPLDGFGVTYDYLKTVEFNGNDVMLNFEPNLADEYLIEIRSQAARTYGPYIFMAQGGVAYPEE